MFCTLPFYDELNIEKTSNTFKRLYVLVMSRTRLRMSRNFLLEAGAKSEVFVYELNGSEFESSCSHLRDIHADIALKS